MKVWTEMIISCARLAQDLSPPAAQARHHPRQSGLGVGHEFHSHGQRICLPDCGGGRSQPPGTRALAGGDVGGLARQVIEQAFARHGTPEIVNVDQGSQFTAIAFTDAVHACGCKLSMDGRGAWRDNVFVERLSRSVKYEQVYLRAYDSVSQTRADGAYNVVCLDGTGTGNTHLAMALGICGITQHSKRVRFYSTVDLVNLLEQEKAAGKAGRLAFGLMRMDLVILDDLGYLPFSKAGGALLFHLLSELYELYENTSVMITAKLTFREWASVFGDAGSLDASLPHRQNRQRVLSVSPQQHHGRKGRAVLMGRRAGNHVLESRHARHRSRIQNTPARTAENCYGPESGNTNELHLSAGRPVFGGQSPWVKFNAHITVI
jgi:hypothetical protein